MVYSNDIFNTSFEDESVFNYQSEEESVHESNLSYDLEINENKAIVE